MTPGIIVREYTVRCYACSRWRQSEDAPDAAVMRDRLRRGGWSFRTVVGTGVRVGRWHCAECTQALSAAR